MLADRPVLVCAASFGLCFIINTTFIDIEETSSYWSVQIFSIFHWSLIVVHLNRPNYRSNRLADRA